MQRPPRGLLGGMLGLPTTDWTATPPADALAFAPADADWRPLGGVEHVFTHFALSLQVWRGRVARRDPSLVWLETQAAAQALPSVFRKALVAGLEQLL